MNIFQQELRKLFEGSTALKDLHFTGRICIGRLTDSTVAKLEFTNPEAHGHYEGIKATVINRTKGPIDSEFFRFIDILGKKQLTPKHTGGPYIWESSTSCRWYSYQPTSPDFERIAEAVGSYLELFRNPAPVSPQMY